MAPHPVQVRHLQKQRAAMRAAVNAALAGQRLTPEQLKLVMSKYDALVRRDTALSGTTAAPADIIRPSTLRSHPQIAAVLLVRQDQEGRKS